MARKFRDLVAQMSPERQAEIAERTAALLREMPLYELRQARQLSQEELAASLKTSQSSISKLERRVDVYVSTLRRYIESMGGELDIIARFPDGSVRIKQFELISDSANGDALTSKS
jgi:DNA-binding transcriptional regulator YiaG